MIKELFVNGCSWTEGHLLQEEQVVKDYATSLGYDFVSQYEIKKDGEFVVFPFIEFYNNFNWAGLVAKKLNIPKIINYSVGAASNNRIVRTTINYVRGMTEQQKQETLVMIGWSIPDRSELYLDDKLGTEDWYRFHASHPFKDTLTWPQLNEEFVERIAKFHQQYVGDVHTDYACVQNFFQQSYLLANLLEHHGIKYYFFNSFPVDWKYPNDNTAVIHRFQKELSDYTKFTVKHPYDNFFSFIDNRPECHLSDGHPNTLGYKLWAEHILNDMKEKRLYE